VLEFLSYIICNVPKKKVSFKNAQNGDDLYCSKIVFITFPFFIIIQLRSILLVHFAWESISIGSLFHLLSVDLPTISRKVEFLYPFEIPFIQFLCYSVSYLLRINVISTCCCRHHLIPPSLSLSLSLSLSIYIYIYIYAGCFKKSITTWKKISIYSEDMYSVLKYKNIVKHIEFYLG
jgi:hypothetical protein